MMKNYGELEDNIDPFFVVDEPNNTYFDVKYSVYNNKLYNIKIYGHPMCKHIELRLLKNSKVAAYHNGKLVFKIPHKKEYTYQEINNAIEDGFKEMEERLLKNAIKRNPLYAAILAEIQKKYDNVQMKSFTDRTNIGEGYKNYKAQCITIQFETTTVYLIGLNCGPMYMRFWGREGGVSHHLGNVKDPDFKPVETIMKILDHLGKADKVLEEMKCQNPNLIQQL